MKEKNTDLLSTSVYDDLKKFVISGQTRQLALEVLAINYEDGMKMFPKFAIDSSFDSKTP